MRRGCLFSIQNQHVFLEEIERLEILSFSHQQYASRIIMTTKALVFLTVDYQVAVHEAMEEFHKHTCLIFVERTKEPNWLLFVHQDG